MEPLTGSLRNPARLAAPADTDLPDSAAEEAFDRLTRVVTRLLGVPVALVSLVDEAGNQRLGSTLIERLSVKQFGGTTDFEFAPDGLVFHATFVVPIA